MPVKIQDKIVMLIAVAIIMAQALQASLFQAALEAIEALSLDDQAVLLDVLQNRLKLRHRQQIVAEVQEVQQEYQAEKVTFGSVDDFLLELDS